MTDYQEAVARVLADPRYQRNINYGAARSGHPEGAVRLHIARLLANLDYFRPRLRDDQEYWKLAFLIHCHDTFKAEAEKDVAIKDPRSHASLARAYAAAFTNEADILNMLQYHDENFALYQQYQRRGQYDPERFDALLADIQDWDLFLIFTIIDGWTEGKDLDKVGWFIGEVRQKQATRVDLDWVPA